MSDKPVIFIIGAGRTGKLLINRLRESWRLKVLDINPEKFTKIQVEGADIELIAGDATSATVLKKSKIDSAYQVLLVINDDEAAEEIFYLLKSRFNVRNIFARINSETLAEKLRSQGAVVVTPYETMANLIINQMNMGETIAINIGKGEGEIIQIELTQNSPLIGKKLKELPPRKWLIGAIYRPKRKISLNSTLSYLRTFQISREDKLIIPDGNTIPRKGDKLILLGDSSILLSTARYLKAGAPVFPIRHGNQIVTMISENKITFGQYREFTWILNHIEPVPVCYMALNEKQIEVFKKIKYRAKWDAVKDQSITYNIRSVLNPRADLERLFDKDKLALLIFPYPKTFTGKLLYSFLYRRVLLKFIHHREVPLWVVKKGSRLNGITLFVSDAGDSLKAAELAIDAAKKFKLKITLLQINPPAAIVGSRDARKADEILQSIHQLGALYGISLEEKILTGNPVYETLKNVPTDQLLVLPYPYDKKRGFLMPPVSEKLLFKEYKGSILTLPV